MIFSIAALLAVAPLGASTTTFQPSIPDVPVVTQDGKSVRFYSDLVKGNTVAVNFIFTNCKTICPMLGGMFANLQKQDNGAVKMISVSGSLRGVTSTVSSKLFQLIPTGCLSSSIMLSLRFHTE
jgi:Uncharacterized protein SCO1/SenC/PrrC, involved in biogenesis of respiratory and photosynthetic systems